MSNLESRIREHLKLREGVVYKVYKDSVGKLTGGVGRLLEGNPQWMLNDPISKKQVDEWLNEDMEWALDAARKNMAEIAVRNPQVVSDDFLIALTSVNFQLGVGWPNVFYGSYPKLVSGYYDAAIVGFEKSKWAKQTPVRVEDFVNAIEIAYNREVLEDPPTFWQSLSNWWRNLGE